jgi:hypothetical protein
MRDIIEMAREAGWKDLRDYDSEMRNDFFMGNTDSLKALVELARADEREQIAKMIEEAPPLMPFAQNDQGGCLMCGFTPKLVVKYIRARENT